MQFRISGDSNVEAGLGELDFDGFREYFSGKQYDDTAINIGVVLMCRDPRLKFERRVRYSRSDNWLYIDVMLDLDVMSQSDHETRKRIVGEKITAEVPQVVAKYKLRGFDLERFASDLRTWFKKNNWLEDELWPSEIETSQ